MIGSSVDIAKHLLDIVWDVAVRNERLIHEAALLVAPSIIGGGVIHAVATGHSQAPAMELAGRAGGLVPTNKLSLTDLVVRGGRPSAVLSDVLLERDANVADDLWEVGQLEQGDAVVMFSNSGVNGAIVEFALRAKRLGLPLVAVTSLRHSESVDSRHPSGKKLLDLADVVLDNGSPSGDAVVEYAPNRRACGVSTLTSCALVHMLVGELIGLLQSGGVEPPVYMSANLPDGHAHNLRLEQRYGARLFRVAG